MPLVIVPNKLLYRTPHSFCYQCRLAEARGYYRSGTLGRDIWVEDCRDAESMAASRSMLLDGEALRLSASLGSMVGTGAARGNLWAAGFG